MSIIRELEEDFKNLVLDHPLYGDLLINLRREISRDVPTAAIASDRVNETIKMLINDEYFESLNKDHRRAVIVHELQHIFCKHLTRFADQYNSQIVGYLINLATDCAINQFNPFKLPEQHVKIKDLEDMTGLTLKEKETAEYYFDALQKEVEKRQKEMESQQGEGDGEGEGNGLEKILKDYAEKNSSDHSGSSDEMKKMDPLDAAALENMMKKAVEKQKQRDLRQGSGSGGSLIDIMPVDVKIHKQIWKNLVNKAFGETPSLENFDVVYGKASRTREYNMFGKRRQLEDQTVYVGIDTSGSVSDNILALFAGHINKAMKGEQIVTNLIQCDWDITDVKMNVKRIPKKTGMRYKGRGGTDLTKILDKIVEIEGPRKKIDLILLTDGYTDWKDVPNINTKAIYTKDHAKIKGIKQYAVLEE